MRIYRRGSTGLCTNLNIAVDEEAVSTTGSRSEWGRNPRRPLRSRRPFTSCPPHYLNSVAVRYILDSSNCTEDARFNERLPRPRGEVSAAVDSSPYQDCISPLSTLN